MVAITLRLLVVVVVVVVMVLELNHPSHKPFISAFWSSSVSRSVSIGLVIRLLEHGSSAALQLQQLVIVDQLADDLVVGERVIGESIHGSLLAAER